MAPAQSVGRAGGRSWAGEAELVGLDQRVRHMIRFGVTWLMLLVGAALLFQLNWQCWRPGVGGASGGSPPGTQLELFFGWPATYRAELWRSNDESLGSRILASAPFYYPGSEMSLEYHAFGMDALTVDIIVALLVLLLVAVIVECALRRAWNRRVVVLLASGVALLLVLWASSQSVSVSL